MAADPPPSPSDATAAAGPESTGPVARLTKLGATIDYGVGDRVIDIDLDGREVSDAELDLLAGFDDLKILNLSNTKVTDAGLAKLAALKKLKFLYLFNTSITDAGMEKLLELPRLEVLCLDQTQITDVGLKTLEELPRLEKLHVHSRGPITDAGLESLKKHPRLFELRVGGPNITESAVAALQEALPNCNIVFDPAVEAKAE